MGGCIATSHCIHSVSEHTNAVHVQQGLIKQCLGICPSAGFLLGGGGGGGGGGICFPT